LLPAESFWPPERRCWWGRFAVRLDPIRALREFQARPRAGSLRELLATGPAVITPVGVKL